MYLTHLEVTNIKRFKRLNLSLTRRVPGARSEEDGEAPRMWTVLVGENGTCKTTLLQCVALAALGSGELGRLDERIIPLFPRLGGDADNEASVEATFQIASEDVRSALQRMWRSEFDDLPSLGPLRPNSNEIRTRLTFRPERRRGDVYFTWMDDFQYQDRAQRPRDYVQILNRLGFYYARERLTEPAGLFVAAYGANRMLPEPGTTPPPPDAVSRLRPLFMTDLPLMATHFADYFAQEDTARRNAYIAVMREVLGVGQDALVPGIDSFDLDARASGPSSRFYRHSFRYADTAVPSITLPQGVQSVLAWVFDLIGQLLAVEGAPTDPGEMQGLVLIDSLDLHLHPALQVSLVPHLRRVLPKMQFIVTAQSPGLLSSFSADEIVVLSVDEEDGAVSPVRFRESIDPRMLSGGELFERYFGLRLGPLNPRGRDRRELAGLLVLPDVLLNQWSRRRIWTLVASLADHLGPEHQWLSEEERSRLAELLDWRGR